MPGYPIPLADPDDPGAPPRRPGRAGSVALTTRARLRRSRRLALLDTHLPWAISGFRDSEFREMVRRRPDTLAFTLQRTTEEFPVPVHALAEFPRVAARAGVTDVYLVFLNFACGVLGLQAAAARAGVGHVRPDISLAPELGRYGIRVHVTLHPGGGLLPGTPGWLLREVAARCATVFSRAPHVLAAIPGGVDVPLALDAGLYAAAPRLDGAGPLRLVFAGDDRPRKGLATLLDAYEQIGRGPHADRFHLDVAGPNEHHLAGLANRRVAGHGWLAPPALAALYRSADVIVAPLTRDRPEDAGGDTGMVDGFPTTAARSAMAAGCLLVASNPTRDRSILQPGRDYVEVPERDPAALAATLIGLLDRRAELGRIAARGAQRTRQTCDVRTVVDRKLAAMGLS